MRPLKKVDPVGLHRQSGIHAQEILKFKIAPHKQKSIVKKFFMQSVPTTTNVVSSNSTQVIQHYLIKFVSDLRQVGGFLHQ
jgi:hypothetical protein